MTSKLSRRDFLKLSSLSMASLAFSPYIGKRTSLDMGKHWDVFRVTAKSVSVYSEPSDTSQILYQRYFDELVNIYYELVSDHGPGYNPIWYRVWGGYMHSAYLVKVKTQLNPIVYSFPETGLISEVTVPYTQSWRYDQYRGWHPLYRLYYSTTHWIRDIDEGPDGELWYKIEDEMDVNYTYFVPAPHLRPVPDEELTPISPDVPPEEKRIEISVPNQTLTAYEGSEIVMYTKISSGLPQISIPGQISTDTPKGDDFHVSSKMPSKHMGNGQLFAETYDSDGLPIYDYELPGVPWTTFFEPITGVAMHGTYWHTNYGTPMSKGCVNMRVEEAKWIFRWTNPVWEPGIWEKRGYGTRIIVK